MRVLLDEDVPMPRMVPIQHLTGAHHTIEQDPYETAAIKRSGLHHIGFTQTHICVGWRTPLGR
ncbi:MAG: hypothetical protein M3P23_12800 [Actinomycetota bacterium]|nr:hypothetical protein [Actinomycetota bacterium]